MQSLEDILNDIKKILLMIMMLLVLMLFIEIFKPDAGHTSDETISVNIDKIAGCKLLQNVLPVKEIR